MADIEKLEFDPQLKAEILINAKMVILASALCKLRIGTSLTEEHRQELLALIDEIAQQYPLLWNKSNFSKGHEIFLDRLACHRESLLVYPVIRES